jgi:hypothetical protein
MFADPSTMIHMKREEMLREAEQARLAAQLPHHHSSVRRDLALACYRLANWLEDVDRYVPPAESGRSDWASDSAAV